MIREHADDKSINRNLQQEGQGLFPTYDAKGWLNFYTVMNMTSYYCIFLPI